MRQNASFFSQRQQKTPASEAAAIGLPPLGPVALRHSLSAALPLSAGRESLPRICTLMLSIKRYCVFVNSLYTICCDFVEKNVILAQFCFSRFPLYKPQKIPAPNRRRNLR